jgi:vacuolar-type H+-ATPase subunit E/Vma4
VKESGQVELFGREFQTVEKGLDPDEVIEFLKAAAGSSEDAFRRLEQFSALQAATKTVEESISQARRLAEYAKKQAESEARQKKTQVVKEAGHQAALMIDDVKENCISSIGSAHAVLLTAIQEALENAREAVSTRLTQLSETIQEAAKERLDKWQTDTVETPSGKLKTDIEIEEAVPDLISLHGSAAGLAKGDSRPAKEPEDDSAYDGPSGTEASSKSEEDKVSVAPDLMSSNVVEASDGLYSGTVSIIIPRGVKDTWMHQFRSRLSQSPGIRIQGETVRDKERIEVVLSLEKPTELLRLLQDLPNVRKVMEAWNTGSPPEGWGPGRASRGLRKPEEVALILQFA